MIPLELILLAADIFDGILLVSEHFLSSAVVRNHVVMNCMWLNGNLQNVQRANVGC